MKLMMIITTAALGALALAACTPAEDDTAPDAATMEAETSAMAPATDGATAPTNGTTGAAPEATTPVNPDGLGTLPDKTPPTLPPEPNGSTSPATSSPPPR